ncbi:hypothetical protein HED22_14700 [Thalassospira sp. HF15]|uniref:hypothetical protein n=1 Tax=Thalassospira sp. HF15 TaxID=2722755 RepID=UPI00142FCE35|nr:hypothetical protein [Thalassospira sp. HF15]NIY76900.1 hypothetical protein [Thalassospira sp. HF15]
MSFSLDHQDLRHRCQSLAYRIADDLAKRQRANGQFENPDFYAKAFAVNLWSRINPDQFSQNIERALDALNSEQPAETYHREFIEYALRDTPGIPRETIAEILRDTKHQCPDVANWQMLGLVNRHKRRAGLTSKLINLAHFAFILHRYWRTPVFFDRPNCFSTQYHAFCTALLTDSGNTRHQRIADRATALIAQLTGTHGYANLLGRGAGQSFGAACALYALTKKGYFEAADGVLFRIEDALLKSGQLPLNLLSPAPLSDTPGPDNPQTPGWYSYNRHDDYLAFTGYWLLKASQLPAVQDRKRPAPEIHDAAPIAQFSSPNYHAQMALCGRQGFDVSGVPVIVTGQGKSAHILMPPTGGEQAVPSLYGPASNPLPAIGEAAFSRFLSAGRVSDNRIDIRFELAGIVGHRQIDFQNTRVIISEHLPDHEADKVDLFRILIDSNAGLSQMAENTIICPEIGVKLTANAPLQIVQQAAFSAAGPATRISARQNHGNSANLTIAWGDSNA